MSIARLQKQEPTSERPRRLAQELSAAGLRHTPGLHGWGYWMQSFAPARSAIETFTQRHGPPTVFEVVPPALVILNRETIQLAPARLRLDPVLGDARGARH